MKKRVFLGVFFILAALSVTAQQPSSLMNVETSWGLKTIGVSVVTGKTIGRTVFDKYGDILFLGIGTGIQHYEGNSSGMPLFLRVRVNPIPLKISMLFMIDFGTKIQVSGDINNHFGGYYYEPVAGMKFRLKEKTSIYIAMGANISNKKTEPYFVLKTGLTF